MAEHRLQLPLSDADVERLRAGDSVLLTGGLYTARDAAHRRMVEALSKGEKLPVDIRGQIIYYVGPTPAKPGEVIGSAGPTTAIRMDANTPPLLEAGLRGIIGKGGRGQQVREALRKHRAVYFLAVGGAGALLSKRIKRVEVVAYEDLGTEAIRRLAVEDFPVIVVDDTHGNDLYEAGVKQYARPAGATV